MDDIEKIYTIPLSDAKKAPRWKRANSAVKKTREFLAKHLKVDVDKIRMDQSVNEKIWERGSQKPPSKLRVKVIKFETGDVEVELARE